MFLIGSFVPSLLVDRIGRRMPMMVGSAGLGISMMMISILLSFKGTDVEKPTASASVAFFFTVRVQVRPGS
jgi:MFS family permease